jgi:hypothetical protein
MKTFRSICAFGLIVSVAPTVAMAGVHLNPTSGVTFDPATGTWKTAPLSDGQTVVINWQVHTKNPKDHWAGVRFRTHVWDNTEVDLTGIVITPGFLGQQTIPSPAATTVPVWASFWHANAQNSGVQMPSSAVFTFGNWTIRAKGTTPANNSDVDITAYASSIIHMGSLGVSEFITLFPSWYVWATSNFQPTTSEPFPTDVPDPGAPEGQWVEVGMTIVHHVTMPHMWTSAFYSKPIGSASVGIEHIPAPGVGLIMMAGGYGASLARRRAGRRRLP